MNQLLILLVFLILHSGLVISQNENEFNVKIQITEHIPYCGGAYPSDEQLNNYIPYNETLVLIDITNGTKKDLNPKNGILYLNLTEGKYAIKEKYKDVPFHEFYSSNNNTHESYIIQGDNDCYKKWWLSNLLEFEIKANDTSKTYDCAISSRCYTGINPCDYYNGPIPP